VIRRELWAAKGGSIVEDLYRASFIRNIGIFNEREQESLKNSTIAVAGVGGVGGLLAERLMRVGVGNIRITDNGTFEPSNLNRQFGCSMDTLGRFKSEVVANAIQNINPDANIYYDNTGINSWEEAKRFVEGADLVIDEMDYGAWHASIYLQRAARQRGLYYVFASAIAFGALLVNFDPQGITLEEYNGMPKDGDLHELQSVSVPMEKIVPVIPTYIDAAMSMEMLQEVISGQRAVPTCSVGVGLTSTLAASNALNILLKRKAVTKAPHYVYLDLLDQVFITGTMS
jgi:tRNA threonylcarbamoyladenosine dehydratase